MKYLCNLFLSLKEVILMIILQYAVLFFCFIVFGPENSIIIGTVILIILQIAYVIYKICIDKICDFDFKNTNYFPYVLLGIGISSVYNMIIFKLINPSDSTTSIPFFLNIICSGIVGPIFEEFLFRHDLIKRLYRFNSNKFVIIILASIIFGLFHTGTITIIYAIIIGIVNSYIYVNSRNIIKPIVVHMAANIFVNLLTGYNLNIMIFGLVLIIISYFIIKYNN